MRVQVRQVHRRPERPGARAGELSLPGGGQPQRRPARQDGSAVHRTQLQGQLGPRLLGQVRRCRYTCKTGDLDGTATASSDPEVVAAGLRRYLARYPKAARPLGSGWTPKAPRTARSRPPARWGWWRSALTSCSGPMRQAGETRVVAAVVQARHIATGAGRARRPSRLARAFTTARLRVQTGAVTRLTRGSWRSRLQRPR